MTSNIVDFRTREAIAIGRAHGHIEQYIKKVDEAMLDLMEVVLQESDTLADEEIWDIYQMEEAMKNFYEGLIRNPKDYSSYNNARDWRLTMEAYWETQNDEPDSD